MRWQAGAGRAAGVQTLQELYGMTEAEAESVYITACAGMPRRKLDACLLATPVVWCRV